MIFDEEKFKEAIAPYILHFIQETFWKRKMLFDPTRRNLEDYTTKLTKIVCSAVEKSLNADITIIKKPRKKHDRLDWWGAESVRAFADACLRFNSGAFTTKNAAYEAYLDYCKTEGFAQEYDGGGYGGDYVGKNMFGKMLVKILPKIKTVRKRINGERVYGWRNLELLSTRVV